MLKSDGRHPETLLVVGAGTGQVPAISAARRLGLRVVAVDRSAAAPGMELADIAAAVDITDRDAVCAVAACWGVGGVLTIQSDIGVPTVGAVVDALGLTGAGTDVALTCSDKVRTRNALAVAGVLQPRFFLADDEAAAEAASAAIGFPCVIKAPASSGSRGIMRVNDATEVAAGFAMAKAYAGAAAVLIEEYIDGTEFGAQCMSIAGECRLVVLHDDVLSPPPFMIPIAHAYPTTLSSGERGRAEQVIRQAVGAVGIREGPANVDVIIGRDGVPRIIEIGARIGATCLPELTTHHTGIDWVETAVRIAMGRSVVLPESLVERPCAAFILEAPADGLLRRVDIPKEIRGADGLLEIEVTARPGHRVSRLRKGTDRIGKVVVAGPSTRDALARAREIRDAIRFEVDADDREGDS